MPGRTIAATFTASLMVSACVTTTAHRLVLIDNPLRQQAVACEARCRAESGPPASADCPPFAGARCGDGAVSAGGADRYAACLDNCPGTRAVDGASCPQPDPGAFCVETTRANMGGIVGGTVAVVGVALAAASLWLLVTFVTAIGRL